MPSSIIIQTLIYIGSFILVWIGAGLVVSTISEFSKTWKLPTFIISFFMLGVLTSVPEITIGAMAILDDDPVIMAGNLLGGIIVIFLGIIPLLGIVGNGIKMPSQLNKYHLIITLLVIIAPAFLTADQKLEKWEAVLLIFLYLGLLIMFSFKQSLFEKVRTGLSKRKKSGLFLLLKVIAGIGILIAASDQIIDSTIFFADYFKISPFFVSLIVVAFGTNIPEISIIFRSIISGRKEIALADYLGSASANTLLLGVFTIIYGKTIQLPNHFFQRFSFLLIGLVLFFFFARSKNTLSRNESILLLALYLGFVLFEIFVIAGLT